MIGCPESAPTGHDVEDLLHRIEPLILKLVSEQLQDRPDHLREDVAQACRYYLWRYSLPRYDPARHLLPFVTACVRRVIRRELRRIERKLPVSPISPDEIAREDQPDVHHLAQQIIEEPERFLTPKQARIFRLVQAGGHPRTIAAILGIAPASVSQSIWRIRKRLTSSRSSRS